MRAIRVVVVTGASAALVWLSLMLASAGRQRRSRSSWVVGNQQNPPVFFSDTCNSLT